MRESARRVSSESCDVPSGSDGGSVSHARRGELDGGHTQRRLV
jgi:hypothetical protein